jgi:hypothetical protein
MCYICSFMTLTMNTHAAFVNVQQMKYVIGSGKIYIWNNMYKKLIRSVSPPSTTATYLVALPSDILPKYSVSQLSHGNFVSRTNLCLQSSKFKVQSNLWKEKIINVILLTQNRHYDLMHGWRKLAWENYRYVTCIKYNI